MPELPLSPQTAYNRLKTLLRYAELPSIRFHDLRHTFATHALTGGVYQINDHLWEGKYSPGDANGKRTSHNVYAPTREECEEKLAKMIEEVKKQIVEEKERIKTKVKSDKRKYSAGTHSDPGH